MGPGAVYDLRGECYCPSTATVVDDVCVPNWCLSRGIDGGVELCGGPLAGQCENTGCVCFPNHVLVDGICVHQDCLSADRSVCSGGGTCADVLVYRTSVEHTVLGACVCWGLYSGELCELCTKDAVRVDGKCVSYYCAVRMPGEPVSECGGWGVCEQVGSDSWWMSEETLDAAADWAEDSSNSHVSPPGLPGRVGRLEVDGNASAEAGGDEPSDEADEGVQTLWDPAEDPSADSEKGLYHLYRCVCSDKAEVVGSVCWPKTCLNRKVFLVSGAPQAQTVVCNGVGTCVRGGCLCNPGYKGIKCQDCDLGYEYVRDSATGEDKCIPRPCLSASGEECAGNGQCRSSEELFQLRDAWFRRLEDGLVSGEFAEQNPELQEALDALDALGTIDANGTGFACLCGSQYVLRRGSCLSVSRLNDRSRRSVVVAVAACLCLLLALIVGLAIWLVIRRVRQRDPELGGEAPLRGKMVEETYVMSRNEKQWYHYFRNHLGFHEKTDDSHAAIGPRRSDTPEGRVAHVDGDHNSASAFGEVAVRASASVGSREIQANAPGVLNGGGRESPERLPDALCPHASRGPRDSVSISISTVSDLMESPGTRADLGTPLTAHSTVSGRPAAVPGGPLAEN